MLDARAHFRIEWKIWMIYKNVYLLPDIYIYFLKMIAKNI
jgi:hypothetical protein